YKLDVIEIPTNEPVLRKDHDDEVYRTTREKNEAILAQVLECRERKQPVLVGTVSIEKSEALAEIFKKRKVPHNVLNARYHEQEAFIIAQAGRPGAVTIATNMAGRGTDIQLGGNLEMRLRQELGGIEDEAQRESRGKAIRAEIDAAREEVRKAGGLFVISCAAAPDARAIPAPRNSSSRSKTTSCASSAPSAWTACCKSSASKRARRSSIAGSTRRSRRRSRKSRRATTKSASTCCASTT